MARKTFQANLDLKISKITVIFRMGKMFCPCKEENAEEENSNHRGMRDNTTIGGKRLYPATT
jgi:hypothetical protein